MFYRKIISQSWRVTDLNLNFQLLLSSENDSFEVAQWNDFPWISGPKSMVSSAGGAKIPLQISILFKIMVWGPKFPTEPTSGSRISELSGS